MQYFDVPLGESLIKATKLFSSAQGISDYFGVSLPTLYAWVRTYHNLSFRQFKRKHVCPARTCIVVDQRAAHYAWKYTVADRVHERGGCICFVEGSEKLIMTTLTPTTVAEILHGEVVLDEDVGLYTIRYSLRSAELLDSTDEDLDGDDEKKKSRKCRLRRAAKR